MRCYSGASRRGAAARVRAANCHRGVRAHRKLPLRRHEPARGLEYTLVMSTESSQSTGLAHAYLLDGRGGCTHLDWDGVARWTPADGALWLNLDYTLPDVKHWLAERS